MAEEKDDWLDDLEDSEAKAFDSGPFDSDDLLSRSDDLTPPPRDEDDLGQADIDALLSGDKLASPATENEDEVSGNLAQSDIETLLSNSDTPVEDQPFSDPDQDEIDKLFSEPDSGELGDSQEFSTEDSDFADVFGSAEPTSSSTFLTPDFDDQEFKLEEDIPDIPDSNGGWNENMSFLDEETVAIPDEPIPAPVPAAAFAEQVAVAAWWPLHLKWRELLANRKRLYVVGAGVAVLILLVAGFFLFKGGEGPPHEKVVQQPPAEVISPQELPVPVTETAPQEPSIGAPVLSDLTLEMPAGSSELAINVEGKDPQNLPLEYEFQSMPEHGQISGHAPLLVYTARADFAGQDSFTLRVTNGKHFSPIATVTISRAAPLGIPEPPAAAVPVEAVPSVPVPATESAPPSTPASISARNVSYVIRQSLVIPWEKIWRKGNSQPFKQEVGVDIVRPPRHGGLAELNGRQSVYTPERSFSGKDTIQYRFTLGELRSAIKTVTILVEGNNRSPELTVAPYLEVYHPGDTVILSASQTKDDRRETVIFRWEQISGVPVVIKSLNSEGSQIAFVAPSSFNTVANPGVVLRVTATDEKGWSVSRELHVKTQSRRNSAIWR